jgi:DNA-binding Lrp family transcriptional regulator
MKSKTSDVEMMAAALLFTEQAPDGQRRTQEQVGNELGLSQAVVSRLLKEARSRGVLVTVEERFEPSAIPTETMQRVRRRISGEPRRLTTLLKQRFGDLAPAVRILPTTPGDWDSRLRQFANVAAPDVLTLISSSNEIVGISWGNSVGSLVTAIQALCVTPPRVRRPLTVIPLMGEPHWRGFAASVGSSKLAHQLDETLNGPSEEKFPSLVGVPPVIPKEVQDAELEIAYKVIEHTAGYLELFGSRRQGTSRKMRGAALADRLDCIVTSLSRKWRPLGYGDETLLDSGGGGIKPADGAILGDLCGVLIHPRAPFTEPNPLDMRLTGIRRTQLLDCATRARGKNSRGPGVICVAIGGSKADVLLACFPALNHVFVDQELATELERRL